MDFGTKGTPDSLVLGYPRKEISFIRQGGVPVCTGIDRHHVDDDRTKGYRPRHKGAQHKGGERWTLLKKG
jgi:hypothetical protein